MERPHPGTGRDARESGLSPSFFMVVIGSTPKATTNKIHIYTPQERDKDIGNLKGPVSSEIYGKNPKNYH